MSPGDSATCSSTPPLLGFRARVVHTPILLGVCSVLAHRRYTASSRPMRYLAASIRVVPSHAVLAPRVLSLPAASRSTLMTGTRPEYAAPPQFYYNADEARKYLSNSHLVETQTRLAQRALELASPVSPPGTPGEPLLFLDVGCGTGLSGDVLTDAGHHWVGVDVSEFMLTVAVERDVDGDAVQLDMGAGLPFRIGVFDGAISVSALQWLCNADRTEHEPRRRLLSERRGADRHDPGTGASSGVQWRPVGGLSAQHPCQEVLPGAARRPARARRRKPAAAGGGYGGERGDRFSKAAAETVPESGRSNTQHA
eukprot:ctg_2606.g773